MQVSEPLHLPLNDIAAPIASGVRPQTRRVGVSVRAATPKVRGKYKPARASPAAPGFTDAPAGDQHVSLLLMTSGSVLEVAGRLQSWGLVRRCAGCTVCGGAVELCMSRGSEYLVAYRCMEWDCRRRMSQAQFWEGSFFAVAYQLGFERVLHILSPIEAATIFVGVARGSSNTDIWANVGGYRQLSFDYNIIRCTQLHNNFK